MVIRRHLIFFSIYILSILQVVDDQTNLISDFIEKTLNQDTWVTDYIDVMW